MTDCRASWRRAPSRPFILHGADGRGIGVAHPECSAFTPAGRGAVVYGKDGAFEVVDMLLVTSLEVMDGRETSRRKKR